MCWGRFGYLSFTLLEGLWGGKIDLRVTFPRQSRGGRDTESRKARDGLPLGVELEAEVWTEPTQNGVEGDEGRGGKTGPGGGWLGGEVKTVGFQIKTREETSPIHFSNA